MANEYDISRAFKRIENDLMDSMMRNLSRHQAEETDMGFNWEQWQVLQLKELERYRRENAKKFTGDFSQINNRIEDLFKQTSADAQAKEESKILDDIRKGKYYAQKKDVSFFNVNDQKLNVLIERTKADFSRAEYAVLRGANDQYRQIIFDAQVYGNVTNDYAKAVDMATHDYLQKGLQTIEYKSKTTGQVVSKHNISDYAEMAIRTGNKRAYLMGEGNAHDAYGIHTIRVNKRTQACPKCVGFLGKVMVDDVYAGGTPKEASQLGVPLLSQAIQAGFLHPNCKDIYSMYIPNVSKPADPWTKQEIEDIVGDYNAEQELQHAEDMAESYARMAKYSLDKENKAKYQARADGWQVRVDEIKAGMPPTPIIPVIPTPPPKPTAPPPVQTPEAPPVEPSTPEPQAETPEQTIRTRLTQSKTMLADVNKAIADTEAELNKIKQAEIEYASLKHALDNGYYYGRETSLAEIFEKNIRQREEHPNWYGDTADFWRFVRDNAEKIETIGFEDEKNALDKLIKDRKKQVKAIQKEINSGYNDLESVIGKPNLTKLASYGEKHTVPIGHFLDDAPTELRSVWNKNADDFNVLPSTDRWGSRRSAKKAYYNKDKYEDGVWLSINKVAKGDDLHPAYETVFHEFGHNLDYVLNRKVGNGDEFKPFTEIYKNGAFGKTIMKEAEEAVEKYGRANGFYRMTTEQEIIDDAENMVRRRLMREDEKAEYIKRRMASRTEIFDRQGAEKAFAKEIKEAYTMAERGDISDMFESTFSTGYPFGAGHGKAYWTKGTGIGNEWMRTGREAFAEMYASRIANDGSWELIQKYFPESIKIFDEIIEMGNTL